MAEFVQRSMEETLPELEQIERVGLFSREEVKSIVKMRSGLEYRLNRLKNEKEDFLKYIEYEKNLLRLIKKRRKKINYFFKTSEIEYTIVVRIQRLYRNDVKSIMKEEETKNVRCKRLCTLYPSDLSLWLTHIRFLHQWNRHGSLSQLFTKLLKMNSRVPGLWILAAKTQLENNHNHDDARRLLLRGIRHHPKSQRIWTEYFRMELLHAYKLNKRMAILQKSQMTLEEDEASLLNGELAKVVYKRAIEAIPDDIQFRLMFAKISQDFDFAKLITNEIYNDLRTTHADKELTWDALARRLLTSLSKASDDNQTWQTEQDSHKIYEDGLQRTSSTEMWNCYIRFLQERLKMQGSPVISGKRLMVLLSVLDRASKETELSEDNYQLWVDAHVNCGQLDEAIAVSERATSSHGSSAAIWEMRLRITMRKFSSEDSADDFKQVREVFDEAISCVSPKHALNLWIIGLDWCKFYDKEMMEVLFEAGCKEHRKVAVPFKECYLEYVAINRGIRKMRKVYKKLKASKPLSVKFFRRKIFLESTQSKVRVNRVREAYEDAVREYGNTEPDLWLDYIKMEYSHQQLTSLETIRQLHWRAKATLEDNHVEEFLNGYILLQLSL